MQVNYKKFFVIISGLICVGLKCLVGVVGVVGCVVITRIVHKSWKNPAGSRPRPQQSSNPCQETNMN